MWTDLARSIGKLYEITYFLVTQHKLRAMCVVVRMLKPLSIVHTSNDENNDQIKLGCTYYYNMGSYLIMPQKQPF